MINLHGNGAERRKSFFISMVGGDVDRHIVLCEVNFT